MKQMPQLKINCDGSVLLASLDQAAIKASDLWPLFPNCSLETSFPILTLRRHNMESHSNDCMLFYHTIHVRICKFKPYQTSLLWLQANLRWQGCRFFYHTVAYNCISNNYILYNSSVGCFSIPTLIHNLRQQWDHDMYLCSSGPRLTSHPWRAWGAMFTPLSLTTLDSWSTSWALREQ